MATYAATRSRLARVAPLVDSRTALLVLFVLALMVHGIESFAWPLSGGRDSTTYLMYYRDIWNSHPSLPELMLFRTPLAPLIFGPLLQLGGAALAEAAMAVAYALSVLAFAVAARAFGLACAVATAGALLVYPAYGALFHQVSSDPIFALAVAIWALATVRTALAPSTWKFALHGVLLLVLVLVRPSSQIFLLMAIVPFLLPARWKRRVLWSAAFLATSIALLGAWNGYNDARYGQFTVSRSGSADVPFYRVFVLEKLVSPSNGPASRKLAAAVSRQLLPLPQYHGVGLRRFFELSNERMWGDLVVLSDRTWGWGSNYAILRQVALEAIKRHPGRYVSDVSGAVRFELSASYSWSAPATQRPTASGLPATSGDWHMEPGGVLWWLATTPDGRIRNDASGLVWRDPSGRSRYDRLLASVRSLEDDLPNRTGSRRLAHVLNAISRIYPRIAAWLAVGFLTLLVRRGYGWRILLPLVALPLAVILVTMLGMPTQLEYRVPFDPVFVLFAFGALLGERLRLRPVNAHDVAPQLDREFEG